MTIDIPLPPMRHKNITVRYGVPAEMRDGVLLFSDIYRPDTAGDLPVLLLRTPYDKSLAQNTVFLNPAWYARYGYMVIVQDCRGRYSSEGVFAPYEFEAQDGHDTVVWAAGLEGSNGDVAMYGFSYPGAIQLQTAVTKPRGLKAIVPAMTSADLFDGWTYEGGVLSQAFVQSWILYLAQDTAHRAGDFDAQKQLFNAFMSLPAPYFARPMIDAMPGARTYAPYYLDWLQHDTYDDYWSKISVRDSFAEIAIPALHVGGWYDIFISGTINNYVQMEKLRAADPSRGEQKLVIGPWHHLPWQQHVGSCDYGNDARNIVNQLQLNWLDRLMQPKELRSNLSTPANAANKSEPVPSTMLRDAKVSVSSANLHDTKVSVSSANLHDTKVSVFVLNSNEWKNLESWPPLDSNEKTFFLHSGGRANSLSGDGTLSMIPPDDEPWDAYLHDPSSPVLSQGGHSCCFEDLAPMGPSSQRKNEIRNDVLVYTSDVLDEDLTVMGLVRATFYAASTADDTDFAVMLCDVAECGLSINIVNSIIRASRRESLSNPSLIEPEKIYEYNIDVGWTAALFKKGHRIRVTICSSNFPHFARTPNTAAVPSYEVDLNDWEIARQTIYHDAEHPSRVILPIAAN